MTMVTLELPEDVARRLMELPKGERSRRAALALREELEEDTLPPPTEEDLASVGRGLADSEAGRVTDGREVLNELRKSIGLEPRA